MITAAVESQNLNRALGGLKAALIASGQSGDAAVIIKDEGRRACNEISKATGPKNKGSLTRRIGRDISRRYSVLSNNIDAQHQGNSALRWVTAGPKFLYGIDPNKDFRGRDSDLVALHRRVRNNPPARKLIPLGKRGKQTIYRVAVPVISKAGRSALQRKLSTKVGRKKASWATSAIAMGETTVPGWVRQHTPSPKAITNLSGLSVPGNPTVTFGSRSPGVMRDQPMIRGVLVVRVKKVVARIRLVLNGYKQDIKQGQSPRQRGKESAVVSS